MLRQIKISYYDSMRKQIDDFDVGDNITNKDFDYILQELCNVDVSVLFDTIHNPFPSNWWR